MRFSALEIVGIVFSVLLFLYIAKKIWNVLYIYILGPIVNRIDVKSYGKWALVTGSTDGIGKQYARQLAARGCNIILVSRSMDKLKAVAAEIEKDFKVDTKIIQIDFSGDLSIYDKLATEVKDLEIGTLVNNVGIFYPYPEYFLDIPDWEGVTSQLIDVNVVSMIRTTGIILPDMVKRGKGIVINVSSAAYKFPYGLVTVYAATKAFVTKFSEGLNIEYHRKGILVQCIYPGYVATNLTKITKTNFFAPSPKTYVRSALRLLGTTSNTYGYFGHSLMGFMGDVALSISETFVIWFGTRIKNNTRGEALKQ